jgi:Mrp family chromosome partitioning ATPase
MSNKFKEMMNILMEQYDYIIFDTPPIGAVIDANMLIEYSDIFLLILKANVAEKAFLEKFNEMRAEKNITSSGIIFNQVKIEKSSNYGYASGYGYGYGDTQSKRRG